MATFETINDVPKTYADLYADYYEYAIALALAGGINYNDCEDVAADIFLKFLERKFLDKFDPSLGDFKTFFGSFVCLYLRGYRDKQTRRQYRYPLIVDMSLPGFQESASTWGSSKLRSPDLPDACIEIIDTETLLLRLRSYLDTVHNDREYETKLDLPVLFENVVRQIYQQDDLRIDELAAKFDVSKPTIYKWMDKLRSNITNYYAQSTEHPTTPNLIHRATSRSRRKPARPRSLDTWRSGPPVPHTTMRANQHDLPISRPLTRTKLGHEPHTGIRGMTCRQDCRRPSPHQAHCPTCHRTFSGVRGFDHHRKNGICLDPATRGMVEKDGLWRGIVSPADQARLQSVRSRSTATPQTD